MNFSNTHEFLDAAAYCVTVGRFDRSATGYMLYEEDRLIVRDNDARKQMVTASAVEATDFLVPATVHSTHRRMVTEMVESVEAGAIKLTSGTVI